MFNKLFTLAVRGGITFGIGIAVGITLHRGLEVDKPIPLLVAAAVWLLGGIYSLMKFNDSYNIVALKNTEDKIIEIIDDKNKRKIEDDMLRIKGLLNEGILTEDEYNQKIKVLKEKYL